MTTGERLVLEPRHLVFARSLADLLDAEFAFASLARPVIAVAGESGSGKSVTAVALAEVLRERGRVVVVLHQDDYFLRPPRANHEHRCVDLGSVGPQEVNLALLATHVAAFRAGRDVTGPRVDYTSDSFTTRELPLANADVLVVEGTYVLKLDDADVRIFLAATHEDTAERRRLRNRDLDAPIVDQVLSIEHTLIAPQVERAHVVIDASFAIRG